MRKITAEWIYTVDSERIHRGVIVISDQNEILEIGKRDQFDQSEIEHFSGIIIPGFINTHCHLELSHMKGKVDTGTGLIPFIRKVVQFRDVDQEVIQEAIRRADKEMYDAGIQAVGDISNKPDTFEVKSQSKIRYFTFVEMFDFLQDDKTEMLIQPYLDTYHQAQGHFSAVPHATYSVSPTLFRRVRELNSKQTLTVSIHNQETPAEISLFASHDGALLDFFGGLGFPIDKFRPDERSPLRYALNHMDPAQRTLLVHNTLTPAEDIQFAHRWSEELYWATCANANLYIENRLPNYAAFVEEGAKMTIGTDSLTSNWQLSVWEEMKTISRYHSYLDFETLLRWATLNGAQALGFDDELGSISVGKKPGLLNVTFDPDIERLELTSAKINRIV